MSEPAGSQGERTTTYMVQDRSSQDELQRLEIQDRMITNGMGGVLPELSDPTSLRRVLDLYQQGCVRTIILVSRYT